MNLKPTLIIPVLALFILMLVPCVYGESPPAIVWQKVLGGSGYDQGNGIAPTSDDGAIAIGWTASSNSGDVGANHGGDDVWVIKLDSTGSVDWQKLFGGAGDDHGDFIEQTTDGGYIFIGETRSSDSGDVGHNHGGEWDIWVVKLDGSGTIQWQQLIGGSGLDLGKTIHQTSDGGYVLCGNQDWGGYIAKLNGSGGITWQKSIGQYNAEYDSVWPTADGGYILSGWTWGYNNPGGPSAWVTKTDGAGTVQWNKVLGGNANDNALEIFQAADGGYVFVGLTASSNSGDVGQNHGGDDIWVVKLNSGGTLQWQKTLGGSSGDSGHTLWPVGSDSFIVGGETESGNSGDVGYNHGDTDMWLVKLDSSGSLRWQETFGGFGFETMRRARQAIDGGFILIGDTISDNSGDVGQNHGGTDIWIVKTSPQVTMGGIFGLVFNDADGNGKWDAGEGGLAGWEVELMKADGSTATVTTAPNGIYMFTGLDAGIYTVSENLQPGWTRTVPVMGTYQVEVASGQYVTGMDFGNKHQAAPPTIPEFPSVVIPAVAVAGIGSVIGWLMRKRAD